MRPLPPILSFAVTGVLLVTGCGPWAEPREDTDPAASRVAVYPPRAIDGEGVGPVEGDSGGPDRASSYDASRELRYVDASDPARVESGDGEPDEGWAPIRIARRAVVMEGTGDMAAPARVERRAVVVHGPEDVSAAGSNASGAVSDAMDASVAALTEHSDEVFRVPVANPDISSPYGYRSDPMHGRRRMHRGVDFRGPRGTPVFATASGRAVMAGYCDGGTGNCIVLDHPGGWRSQYFHLDEVHISVNARVEQGQHIGDIGSTGRSTGPHLHFQLGRDGDSVDPMDYIGEPLIPE